MSDTETRGERAERASGGGSANKRIALAVIGLLALIYVILFIAKNGQDAEVDWVFGTTTGPLVWVIFVAALLGAIIGAGGVLLFQSRRRRKARRAT